MPHEAVDSSPATGSTGAGEARGNFPDQHFGPGAQHMNIMALTCELVARVWELLADASIVGEAQGPAAWMPSSRQHALTVYGALSDMLSCCNGRGALQMHDNSGGQ
jgi:hypothetical protein